MSNLSAKRQRANTNGDAVLPSTSPDDYRGIIATFDESTLRDLLLSAATNSSLVATQVVARRNEIVNAENTRVIDFDHFNKSVWHAMAPGEGSSGSRHYQLGLEVSVTIEETIAKIKRQTPSHSSFNTKKSALVTLTKIAKTIFPSGNDGIGHIVVDELHQGGKPLDSAIHYIVNGMSEDERDKMRSDQEWVDKVKELVELGRRHGIYDTLDPLLKKLGVEVVDDRVQKPEMDFKTVGKIAPAKQARKSVEAVDVEILNALLVGAMRMDRCLTEENIDGLIAQTFNCFRLNATEIDKKIARIGSTANGQAST